MMYTNDRIHYDISKGISYTCPIKLHFKAWHVILLFKIKTTLCRCNILKYIQSTGLLGILQMVVLLVLSLVDQYLKPVLSSIIDKKVSKRQFVRLAWWGAIYMITNVFILNSDTSQLLLYSIKFLSIHDSYISKSSLYKSNSLLCHIP